MGRSQTWSALDIRQTKVKSMGSRQGTGGGKSQNLYQRDGVFYARIIVDGREYRRSLKTRDEREAKRRLNSFLKEHSPYVGTVRHTFKEAATLWLEAGQWKPKTATGYIRLLKTLLEQFSDKYWDQIDKALLMEFQAKKIGEGRRPATVNRYLTVISGIADHVRELPGWPEVNPVKLVPVKSRKEKRHPYIRAPQSDLDAYFARMRSTFGDLCRFALLTGARKDEIATLQRKDVQHGRIQLWKTKHHFRVIPITDEVQAIIDRQPVNPDSPYLFNTRDGGPYRRITEMWREIRIRAQMMAQKDGRHLTPVRFHDLRHEYAIRYLENGGSIYALQKLLGHSTIAQTEWYLRYLTPDMANKVMAH